MSPLRWGIASVGKISNDFCNALNILGPQTHKIAACAARDYDRAAEFSKKHGIDRAYGSYDEMSRDEGIDIVYVSTIHPTHLQVAKMFLEAGKHVLCEKPLTCNEKQTKQLVDAAKKSGKFFMEGIWSRFTPVYRQLRSDLDSGAIGEVTSVSANFCVPILEIGRISNKITGGGCILDIGIYLLQLADFVFGSDNITRKHFTGKLSPEGIDEYCSMTLEYNDGDQVAHLFCDGRVNGAENKAMIMGTKGTIIIGSPFWTPLDITSPAGSKHFPLEKSPLPMVYCNSENFIHEIQAVAECIQQGKVESDIMPHSTSIHLAQQMDAARHSVGVVFEEDNE